MAKFYDDKGDQGADYALIRGSIGGKYSSVQDYNQNSPGAKGGTAWTSPIAPQITTPMQAPDSSPFALGGGRSGGGYGSPMGYQDESDQLYRGLDNYRNQILRNYVMRYWR